MARRSDKVVLASHTHTSDKSYDYVEKVKQVMSSPGWATVTTNKLSLEDGGYLFFVLIDEVRAGLAARSTSHPAPRAAQPSRACCARPRLTMPPTPSSHQAARAGVHCHHLAQLLQPLYLL